MILIMRGQRDRKSRSKWKTPPKGVESHRATILTDKMVMPNQPDIVVVDKQAVVIDVAMPCDSNTKNKGARESSKQITR